MSYMDQNKVTVSLQNYFLFVCWQLGNKKPYTGFNYRQDDKKNY